MMRRSVPSNNNATYRVSMFDRGKKFQFLLVLCHFFNLEILSAHQEPRRQHDYDGEQQRSLRSAVGISKQLNILTLGGSVTWGATLSDNRLAYPYLIGNPSSNNNNNNYDYNVHNLAIRASDAYFPSLCIESMIREADVTNVEFDVIILEYSINGFSGMTTLIKRLQYRYPDAVLIYVHLISLRTVADRATDSTSWTWKPNRFVPIKPHPKVTQLLEQVGAYIYTLPIRADRPASKAEHFYAIDGHHLSEKGHRQVANDLLELLNNAKLDEGRMKPDWSTDPHRQFLHTWGEGDHCSDWFTTGKLDNPNVLQVAVAQGGGKSLIPTMLTVRNKNGTLSSGKKALEFPPAGGAIVVRNDRPHPVALYLSYMAAFEMYPEEVRVTINDDFENFVTLRPTVRQHHVRKTTQVGLARPGENLIRIQPLEGGKDTHPFRLVGVALFGFSYNMGLPLRTARNTLIDSGGNKDAN